jgi:hypothetical protein
MGRLGILREAFELMRHKRKYWLLPIVALLLLFGLLIVLSANSSLAPLIYTIF